MKKGIKSVAQKSKIVLKRVRSFVINKKTPDYYAYEGHYLLNTHREERAVKLWNKGVKFYPNSLLIHREFALYFMEKDHWKQAAEHWTFVFKSKNKHLLEKDDFLNASTSYLKCDMVKQSIEVLKSGVSKYPTDSGVIYVLAQNLMMDEKWEEAIEWFTTLFRKKANTISTKVYLGLARAYRSLSYHNKTEYVLREGLKVYPDNKEIASSYAQSGLDIKDWEKSIQRYEYLIKLYEEQSEQVPAKILLTIVMLYQVIGKAEKAVDYFQRIPTSDKEKANGNQQSYQKITLFENDGSRIDFFKKYQDNKKIFITFDSLNMDWHEPPFGFKLLLREDVDIIAVRQKEKKTYQQSLSQEEFMTALKTLVGGYEDKMAYGHSLGGYTSLYFASNLNCRILALAPRISVHPIYGNKEIIQTHEFQHRLDHNYNDKIKPIIVYDSKDKMDNKYINEALLPAYPNAIIIELKYGGHGIARHLLRMGVLKEYVLTFIEGKVPRYRRELKRNSVNYCRLLGRECLKRGKLKWAKALSDRTLELMPDEKYSIRLRVDVLKTLDRNDEALKYIKNEVRQKPRSLYIRLVLIDLYIHLNDLINADREVQSALKSFKGKTEFYKRQKEIETVRQRIINQPLDFI